MLNFPQSTSDRKSCARFNLPILVDAPDGRISQLTLDTSTVNSVCGPSARHQLTMNDACTQLRAASKQYAVKKAKYDAICYQNGFKFAPLIFESTGKFHQVTETFFKITTNTVTHGMHREFASISKYYWAARLSCCLHKRIAYSLSPTS